VFVRVPVVVLKALWHRVDWQ